MSNMYLWSGKSENLIVVNISAGLTLNTFQFVHRLFATQCKIQQVELSLETGDQKEVNELMRAAD